MKIELKKLLKILELSSIDWLIDPIVINFDENGITALNLDEATTMMALIKIPVNVIEGYSSLGRLVFSEDIYKSLKKMFKGEERVELDLKEDKIVIKGSRETFRFPNQALAREQIEPDIKQTEYGNILAKPSIQAVYRVDYTIFRDLPYEELIKLTFKQEGILIETDVSGGVYEAWAKVLEIKQKPETDVVATFDGDTLTTMADLIESGVGWMIATESPLHITSEDRVIDAKITYVISPRVVE